MKLAEKIYNCRKKLGYSQEQLAQNLDVSRQAISKWETGTALPEVTKISQMAKLFGVTTDCLLSEDDKVEQQVEQEQTQTQSQSTSNQYNYGYGYVSQQPYQTNNQANNPYSSQQYANPTTYKNYPDWVDRTPRFLCSMFKKYGWLVGLYITIIGFIISTLAILCMIVAHNMNTSTFQSPTPPTYGVDSPFSKDDKLYTGDSIDDVIDQIQKDNQIKNSESVTFAIPSNFTIYLLFMPMLGVGLIIMTIGIVVMVNLRKYRNS